MAQHVDFTNQGPHALTPLTVDRGSLKERNIVYTCTADGSKHYGHLILSNIKYDPTGDVAVHSFLGMVFLSPADLRTGEFKDFILDPWADLHFMIDSCKNLGDSTFRVTARLMCPGHKFSGDKALKIGITGDVKTKSDLWTKSFVLAADEVPDINGTVDVTCPQAPFPGCNDCKQTLTFTNGKEVEVFTVPLDHTTLCRMPGGPYAVTASKLHTKYQTHVANATPKPDNVVVERRKAVPLYMTYSNVEKFSAIDVFIGKITALADEHLHVHVASRDFWSPVNHKTEQRLLPPSGQIVVKVDPITLNNITYSFDDWKKNVSPEYYPVLFEKPHETPVKPVKRVQVFIQVEAASAVDNTISVRLAGASSGYIYSQKVKAQSGSTLFPVKVETGDYHVQAKDFIHEGVVYAVDAPSTLTVKGDSVRLALKLRKGANLHVRGFPNFLSFGCMVDFSTLQQEDNVVQSRLYSIMKYSGRGGDGDPEEYLDTDEATVRTLDMARAVEKRLGHPVLPLMNAYTCNLSGNFDPCRLTREDWLAHSFGNLILALDLAQKRKDDKHPVPAGFVLNPDFLGACKQAKLPKDHSMHVKTPLKMALDHRERKDKIPEGIPETIAGYVSAVNWLVRTVAPDVSFGWVINLWGLGSAEWIYGKTPPAEIAKGLGDYAKDLGVFGSHGIAAPDFLAIDRYERDDFTTDAYQQNGYCFGPYEWRRYFDLCRELSVAFQVPVMPWQIPSSRIPLLSDDVHDDIRSLDKQHWGTGGSYILGDAGVNSRYQNIHPKILALKLSKLTRAEDVKALFIRGEPFDLTNPAYRDLSLRGIFAVLLGGGQTLGAVNSTFIGVDPEWQRERLAAYMVNPNPPY